jgi:hypothetical protein
MNLPPLEKNFSVNIPASMVNLQALIEFVLFKNHFTSSVPGKLGQNYNLA